MGFVGRTIIESCPVPGYVCPRPAPLGETAPDTPHGHKRDGCPRMPPKTPQKRIQRPLQAHTPPTGCIPPGNPPECLTGHWGPCALWEESPRRESPHHRSALSAATPAFSSRDLVVLGIGPLCPCGGPRPVVEPCPPLGGELGGL